MSTQSEYRVTVSIDKRPVGEWDTRSGGEVDSDISRRQTSAGPKVYNSRTNMSDVTVGRGYERERDHELARTLEPRAGRAEMIVSEQPLDEDGNAWGKPKVWTGKLKGVNTGEVDSDSGDPRMIELTMTVLDVV